MPLHAYRAPLGASIHAASWPCRGVGQRNYHYFFGFISCVLVLAMMVLPATGQVTWSLSS